MFRGAVWQAVRQARLASGVVNSTVPARSVASVTEVKVHHYEDETPEMFDKRFLDFFTRPDLDGWLVRQGMTELHHHDVAPEPTIVSAALRACRKVNDYALAIRFLEALRIKCQHKSDLYPYILQEVQPTLDELGISTPEQLGYDKPEFFLPSVDYWDWENYPEGGNTKKH